MYEVVAIDTPSLGDRSYLVHDGAVAFVVDPQRDIDRILGIVERDGVRIADVFETHVHNDYVTGGYALARACDAAYHVNAEDPVAFARQPISPGDLVAISPALTVRAVAAPGHTHTHLAYALEHDGETVAVFSGGSLLYGSVGRPDLLGPDHTQELAREQWATAQRLAALAPESAALYPTHGFGSFCSSSQSDVTSSTIGDERRTNPVLRQAEQVWVDELLAGLDAWPAYYAHMTSANLAGPNRADLAVPVLADADDVRRRLAAGEWVVDLRHRKAFCERHVTGTLSFGLEGGLATYLGWLIPWGTPVTLLGETVDDVAAAQRELARIGIDGPAAATIGDIASSDAVETASLRRVSFAELAAVGAASSVSVLDVRRRSEWEAGHLPGAIHIPLHELAARLDEVPGDEVWVHCGSGYRATIAASLLVRVGRRPVVIDDDFTTAADSGLTVTTEGTA